MQDKLVNASFLIPLSTMKICWVQSKLWSFPQSECFRTWLCFSSFITVFVYSLPFTLVASLSHLQEPWSLQLLELRSRCSTGKNAILSLPTRPGLVNIDHDLPPSNCHNFCKNGSCALQSFYDYYYWNCIILYYNTFNVWFFLFISFLPTKL